MLSFRGGNLEKEGRDDGFVEKDPSLTTFQNIIRYMKQNSQYLPPNPWPNGMVLYLISKDTLSGITFATLDEFESFTTESFFSRFPIRYDCVIFCPATDVPREKEEAEAFIKSMTSMPNFNDIVSYMYKNGWYENNTTPIKREINFN